VWQGVGLYINQLLLEGVFFFQFFFSIKMFCSIPIRLHTFHQIAIMSKVGLVVATKKGIFAYTKIEKKKKRKEPQSSQNASKFAMKLFLQGF
jgi:hypothetical protein